MRGLKLIFGEFFISANKVAPHAGAWIETTSALYTTSELNVAPHAGAWIETRHPRRGPSGVWVAPHAGAWIETKALQMPGHLCIESHPTRVRGLKLAGHDVERVAHAVAPHTGA